MRCVISLLMPVAGSYTGARCSPESTTAVTPSMVMDDSAMGVAITTRLCWRLRLGLGPGRRQGSWWAQVLVEPYG